jgi:hypothetical protein
MSHHFHQIKAEIMAQCIYLKISKSQDSQDDVHVYHRT